MLSAAGKAGVVMSWMVGGWGVAAGWEVAGLPLLLGPARSAKHVPPTLQLICRHKSKSLNELVEEQQQRERQHAPSTPAIRQPSCGI